jgi:hypothetical protein
MQIMYLETVKGLFLHLIVAVDCLNSKSPASIYSVKTMDGNWETIHNGIEEVVGNCFEQSL